MGRNSSNLSAFFLAFVLAQSQRRVVEVGNDGAEGHQVEYGVQSLRPGVFGMVIIVHGGVIEVVVGNQHGLQVCKTYDKVCEIDEETWTIIDKH